MPTGESFPSNSGEINSAENSGDNGWSNFPPFNPEQKQLEPSPTEVIDTLYDRYANQLTQEEDNIEDGFPSLSEKDFTELRFRDEIIKKVFVQEGTKKHDEGFSYSSYFKELRNAALNNFHLQEDGAEVLKFDDGTTFITKQDQAGFYKYNPTSINEEELYTIIGADKRSVNRDQLMRLAETCSELAIDAGGLEHGLDTPVGFGRKIRPREETMSMAKNRVFEQRQEFQQKHHEEDIEKYGPELNSQEIMSHDKLDKYEKEKAAEEKKATYQYRMPDGTNLADSPNPDKIKEYDELIETEKKKLGEEQGVWDELHFKNEETHAFDAIGELNQYIESLSAQIKDAEASHTFDPAPVVRSLKSKQNAARRLFNKIRDSLKDDGISMEQMPTGKTKEQIEAEASEKKRKEEEEYQKRVNEYWEQKRRAEQKQREENERQIRARQEAEAERQRQIREAEEVARRNADQQQFEEEQEEGMSM